MNAPKRRRISSGEINQVLDEESDTDDLFDGESSSSESSSDEDIEGTNSSSDSGSEYDFSMPSDWTPRGRERDPFNFVADPGVKFTVKDKENPLEYFEKFFDDEIIDYLVEETNRFAKQFLDENVEHLPPHSRVHGWFDTYASEMKVFIGLIILQGIDSKCDNSMYFSTRESVSSPFFRKVMNGRRFDLLHKFLHLVDNSTITDGPGRKLAKIKPFADLILKKFMNNYIPSRNVSVDESLLGWKGNLPWVQYIPAKHKRFGIKFYELCESSTGYKWNFFIYAGKDTQYMEKYMNLPVSNRIVSSLIDPLLNKGYCLYTEDFYTSPTLADALADEKTDIVGTVRVTRKDVPAKIKGTKLKKGEKVAEFRKKSMVLKWKDKMEVCVLSTMHDDSMMKVKSRRGKEMYKPKAVADYNANVGGGDLSDNLLVHFLTARNRLKKCHRKVFRHLLDMSVLNCYVTYRALGGRVVRREFILRISERLIMKYGEERPVPLRRPPRLTAKPSRLIGRHFPEYCPATDKKKRPQRICAQCRKNNIRRDSSYWCKDCEVGLCVAPCFRDWHTKE
ncbi:piggyBac transposable element-derived protein 4-like [Macrobrachium nipponense]|uniref:piggyBac transposable element-derived protein 4-like n=1 Tax=Macrobrachium nipponense TaxID=159736 RepID=UPI0030C856D6